MDGSVALERMVFLFVAVDEPVAVKAYLEKAVAVYDVVAIDFLDSQDSALDIGRIRAEIRPMDARKVTAAFEKNLAVVPRQLAHPVEKGEAVGPLAFVGNPITLAHAASAAVLHDVCVAARKALGMGLRKGIEIGGLLLHVWGALHDDRAFFAVGRARAIGVEPGAVGHRHHLLEDGG